jgi:hypothetical protein
MPRSHTPTRAHTPLPPYAGTVKVQFLIEHTSGLLFNVNPPDSGNLFSMPTTSPEVIEGMKLIAAARSSGSRTLWRVEGDFLSLTFPHTRKDFKIVRKCTERPPPEWIVDQRAAIVVVKNEKGGARGCAESTGW